MITKEKVRELADLLRRKENLYNMEDVITEWLDENQPLQQVVGLSDELIDDLSVNVRLHYSPSLFVDDFKKWQQTKTFAHYNNEGKVYELDGNITDYFELYNTVASDFVELEKERDELQNKCEMLELGLEVFKPNWNNYHKDCVRVQIKSHLILKDGSQRCILDLTSFERPQPTQPVVEVGQDDWVNKENQLTYTVHSIGKLWVSQNNWIDGVTYHDDSGTHFFTKPLSDFLAKFERVS